MSVKKKVLIKGIGVPVVGVIVGRALWRLATRLEKGKKS